jgi:hypothetical protein
MWGVSEATHAYAGFKHCGCCVAAVVDRGKSTDKAMIADFIRQRLTIERLPIGKVRKRLKRCNHVHRERQEELLK